MVSLYYLNHMNRPVDALQQKDYKKNAFYLYQMMTSDSASILC